MVDRVLLQQVPRLDVVSRRELVRALQESIDRDEVPAEERAEVERRLAEMGPEPSAEYVTLDEFKRKIAGRRAR